MLKRSMRGTSQVTSKRSMFLSVSWQPRVRIRSKNEKMRRKIYIALLPATQIAGRGVMAFIWAFRKGSLS